MSTSSIVAQKKNGKAVKQLNSRERKGNNPIKKTTQNIVNGADLTFIQNKV